MIYTVEKALEKSMLFESRDCRWQRFGNIFS